jgi:hypothetical protein
MPGDGPEVGLPSVARPASTPKPRPKPAGNSTVGGLLLTVVVIGVGIVASVTLPPLGIAFLVPAFAVVVWTWIVTYRREKEGHRMDYNQTSKSFAWTLGGILLVLISSSIAFTATCVPLGFRALNPAPNSGGDQKLMIAFGVGGMSALVVGIGVSRFLIKMSRSRTAKKSQDKERP